MPIIFLIIVVLIIGAQPSVVMTRQPDGCKHIEVTRFFGLQIVETTWCPGDPEIGIGE